MVFMFCVASRLTYFVQPWERSTLQWSENVFALDWQQWSLRCFIESLKGFGRSKIHRCKDCAHGGIMPRAVMASYWFKAVFIKFNLIWGLHGADVPHSSRAGSWSVFWWRWFSIHTLNSLLCIDQLLFDLSYQKVTGSILWSFVEMCSVVFV